MFQFSRRGVIIKKRDDTTDSNIIMLLWRSRWDLNPRAAHHGNTISNRARYGHFDTTPYIYHPNAPQSDYVIIPIHLQ